ncbi:MAG: hypothetical protein H6948_02905 [Zoogloeaceae bacterium]|nr:hypothetical protein [Zoogloeaceae bacterium]
MIEYAKQKSLYHEFRRIRVDEEHLFRIARQIEEIATSFELEPTFHIEAYNGEDSIKTKDPGFFVSEHMPESVHSITMGIDKYRSPVSINLVIGRSYSPEVFLEVTGSDTDKAIGVFSEIKREIEQREIPGDFFIKFADGFIGYMTLAFIAAAVVYSLFDFPLEMAYHYNPGFKESELAETIRNIGKFTVMGVFALGGGLINKLVTKALPKIEFAGRLESSGKQQKKILGTIFTLLVLPIALNLASSFIKDFIDKW